MRAEKDRIVSIDYSIRLAESDEVVESSIAEAPLDYLHGHEQIVPGIESAIEGREPGSELTVELEPLEGYGERDPEGVFLVPRGAFPDDEELSPGTAFSAVRPDGQAVLFRIVRAAPEAVLVDANHPLAGHRLRVWIAVRSVREATPEERLLGNMTEGTIPYDGYPA